MVQLDVLMIIVNYDDAKTTYTNKERLLEELYRMPGSSFPLSEIAPTIVMRA